MSKPKRNTRLIQFRIPNDLAKRLDALAEATGRKTANYAAHTLTEHILNKGVRETDRTLALVNANKYLLHILLTNKTIDKQDETNVLAMLTHAEKEEQ